MSAASFLGISAAVMANGYDGLIYSIGFLVGWPVITFLMAERLRNLGKFTFADVAAYRFEQTPIRVFAASGTLVVVAFYLIAQMVGAGPADQAAVRPGLLDRGGHRRRADDGLRAVRRHDRHHLGADHQGLPAARRRDLHGLHGAVALRLQPRGAVRQGGAIKTDCANVGKTPRRRQHGPSIMGPGSFIKDPISAICFGMALMFGTAGLPHILMRFFTVPNAKEARKSVFWATDLDRLLLPADLHHRLRRHHLRADQPGSSWRRQGRAARRQQHGGGAPGQRGRRQRLPRLHLGGGLRDHPGGGGRA